MWSLTQLMPGCLGCWCPCILYGKTQDRYKGDHESSGINGSVRAFNLKFARLCVGHLEPGVVVLLSSIQRCWLQGRLA